MKDKGGSDYFEAPQTEVPAESVAAKVPVFVPGMGQPGTERPVSSGTEVAEVSSTAAPGEKSVYPVSKPKRNTRSARILWEKTQE